MTLAAPNLKAVRTKLARAREHFEDVNRTVKSFLGPDDYTQEVAEHEFLNGARHLIVRAKEPKAVDARLSLVVGDCLHNLRSALDHLVLQLAVRNGTISGAENKTSFPVCLTPAAFKDVMRKIAPYISAAALSEIENMQPYTVRDPRTNAPLGENAVIWVLSQLDIIDKHRVILVPAPQIAAEGFLITGPRGEKFEESISPLSWKAWKKGEEIIRFDLSKLFTAPGGVRAQIRLATIIQFANTGLFCDGRGVQSTLEDCIRVATTIVDNFGKQFFGE
jgi:hypothetical protein